jgi:putative GTP pyrophosphokinase
MSEDELQAAYIERLPLLKQLADNLEIEAKRHLEGMDHIDRVSFRAKGLDSFLKKVFDPRKPDRYESPLEQVEDQVAGRVIVFYRDEVDVVRMKLAEIFGAVEESLHESKDVSSFSYESFHSIVVIPHALRPEGWAAMDKPPTTCEIQIRTLFQHAYAESEHDLMYKPPIELEREEERKIAWVAASTWGADEILGQAKTSIYERVERFESPG